MLLVYQWERGDRIVHREPPAALSQSDVNSISLVTNAGHRFFLNYSYHMSNIGNRKILSRLPALQGRNWRCHWGCCNHTRRSHLHDPMSCLAQTACRAAEMRLGSQERKNSRYFSKQCLHLVNSSLPLFPVCCLFLLLMYQLTTNSLVKQNSQAQATQYP